MIRQPYEIDLHGLTVDEALIRLDHFIHEKYMTGYFRVIVVHGKGTGTLRDSVRSYLTTHPLVKSFYPASPKEGGYGATVVELV